MRMFVALLACSWLLAGRSAAGNSWAPMTAYVTGSDACARSGPGPNYYPTEKLKPGQRVEVYRIDPGGWCAIRPVEGSFAWVSGRYLKPTTMNLAVVTEDNVPAYVGSSVTDARNVVQIRLRKGEMVGLLESPLGGTQGGEENGWVKIAPPSGEFRWVAGEFLDSAAPKDASPDAVHAVRPAAQSASVAAPNPGRPPVGGDSSRPQPLSEEAFQKELDRLQLELSSTVTENTAVWSFESLRNGANWLLQRAQTAAQRGQARELANRIDRFDDIKQRYDAVHAAQHHNPRPSRPVASLPPRDGTGDGGFDADDRFDGVGRLAAVEAPQLGAPRYALLNEAGEVRCYVTPAPGLNLRGYIGKQVGVTGTRGYMPEKHARHLVARHIAVLDGSRLR